MARPAINALISNGTIVKAKIVQKAGIKIGLLGIMGENADFDAANASPLTFDHTYARLSKAQVNCVKSRRRSTCCSSLSRRFYSTDGNRLCNASKP